MSSPLPPGPRCSASSLETVLAEHSGFLRRRTLPAPRARMLGGLSFRGEALTARPRQLARAAGAHRVLVVADDTQVRLAVARELARRFDLLHAVSFTSAARKLEAGEAFSALVVDLGLSDTRGAPWFLARLVDHAFEGPRILLSGAIRPERASSLSRGSVTHFALARPWPYGALRTLLETALGPRAAQVSAPEL